MAEKSRRWSPYNYAENNPIRNIDPDGMIDVHINGDQADEATKQLQASTSLTISRDDKTGKITATGDAKTNADKKLLAAITDHSVDVSLTASSSNQAKAANGQEYNVLIGKYLGSHMGSDGKTPVGDQAINMTQANTLEKNGGNKASESVFHELMESFIALKTGNGIHDAGDNSVYKTSHNGAKALDPSYSEEGFHVDNGKYKLGYDTYYHENPTTKSIAILLDVKQ